MNMMENICASALGGENKEVGGMLVEGGWGRFGCFILVILVCFY